MILTETEILLLRALDDLRERGGDPELIARVEGYFRSRNKPLTFAEWDTATRNWRAGLRDDNKKLDTV